MFMPMYTLFSAENKMNIFYAISAMFLIQFRYNNYDITIYTASSLLYQNVIVSVIHLSRNIMAASKRKLNYSAKKISLWFYITISLHNVLIDNIHDIILD